MRKHCVYLRFLCFFSLLLSLFSYMTPANAQTAPELGWTGNWKEDCQCYRNIDYGNAEWQDIINGNLRDLRQNFDFFPVSLDAKKQPLIIYAHPNGRTKMINATNDPFYDKIIVPARQAGFAVAALEFRHPVSDKTIVPTPHFDIARNIQWIRGHADQLGIDKNNIFFLGHSRGTLVLWTGVQDDMANPKSPFWINQQSTRVNAIYAYNAQSTYRGDEQAELYIVPEERVSFNANYEDTYKQHEFFGSALEAASADDPPLMLRHEFPFFRHLVHEDEMGVHHPDFGLTMCKAYKKVGIEDKCTTIDKVPGDLAYQDIVYKNVQYDGFVKFFTKHLKKSE